MQVDSREAAAALASARETRQRFERTLTCGPGYSAAFGVLMGWLVGIQGLPVGWKLLAYVPFVIALVIMVRYQRRTTGRFVNGYRAGRTRWVAIGGAAVVGVMVVLAAWLSLIRGIVWAAPALGVVAAILGFFVNQLWMRAYRADVEEGRP